jgi:hypothetical protein
MDLYVAVHRPRDSIEVDTLVRTIPASDMAELATDAKRLVDFCDDLVIQVQVLPLRDPG